MEHVHLGTSELTISPLVLGTATFGVSPDEDGVAGLVGAALDAGITLFDTSNSYGNQPDYTWRGSRPWNERASSEELLGSALRGAADDVLVATKVGEPLGQARIDGPFVGHLGRDHILEQAGISLSRLGRERIDIYYAHQPDPVTPADEIVAVFNELIVRGDVREWGVSNFTAADTQAVLDACERAGLRPPAVHQSSYSLARRERAEEVLPVLEHSGIPLLAYSPLGMGLLTGRAGAQREWAGHRRWGGGGFSDAQLAAAGAFEDLAADAGLPPAQLAVAWLLNCAAVSGVILGATSVGHLLAARGAADITLPPDLMAALAAIPFPAP